MKTSEKSQESGVFAVFVAIKKIQENVVALD